MNPVPARASAPSPDIPLLAALYLLEASALLATVAYHTKGSRALLDFLASPSGGVFLVAALALVAAATTIAFRYRTRARRASRSFGLTLMLNLVPVLVLFASGEVAVRLLSRTTPRGPVVMGRDLLPRQWSDVVARNEAILKRVATDGSYLVPDELLGWVVGPNRGSADGLKFSSAEGIRSARAGVVFADRPGRRRIALVGDSFTFGLDVSYEESWGHRLERDLGPDVQVLNFGVEAYGVDQAYLRYERDARPWRPDVVVLGLIDHDLWRSMAVYFFVSFPSWEYPFAKPRFVADGDRLVLLNVPLPSPGAILAARSIRDLPFVAYDPGYREEDWQGRALDGSYLYRFVVSTYRSWWPDARAPLEAVFDLNGTIVRSFIRRARAEGSMPIVVYFPSDRDFRARAKDPGWRSLAQTMLRRNDIPYTDLTPCLAAIDPTHRFPADGRSHYLPPANAAIAGCLREKVLTSLGETAPRPLTRPRDR